MSHTHTVRTLALVLVALALVATPFAFARGGGADAGAADDAPARLPVRAAVVTAVADGSFTIRPLGPARTTASGTPRTRTIRTTARTRLFAVRGGQLERVDAIAVGDVVVDLIIARRPHRPGGLARRGDRPPDSATDDGSDDASGAPQAPGTDADDDAPTRPATRPIALRVVVVTPAA